MQSSIALDSNLPGAMVPFSVAIAKVKLECLADSRGPALVRGTDSASSQKGVAVAAEYDFLNSALPMLAT